MSKLRQWFGPSREEVWRQLAGKIEGQYVDGGFWHGDKVEATHGPWLITLDTFVVSTGKTTLVFTRMRAPYVNPDNFRFKIYRKSIFSALGKYLGMQDVTIGEAVFDDQFIIKASDEIKVGRLLQNERIRGLIAAQPQISFSVEDSEGVFRSRFPEDVDKLEFQVVGVIKEVDRLRLLFDLFAETLDELCKMGSATEKPVRLL